MKAKWNKYHDQVIKCIRENNGIVDIHIYAESCDKFAIALNQLEMADPQIIEFRGMVGHDWKFIINEREYKMASGRFQNQGSELG